MEKREKELKSLVVEGKVNAYKGMSQNTLRIAHHSPEVNDLQSIHSLVCTYPVQKEKSIFFKLNVLKG